MNTRDIMMMCLNIHCAVIEKWTCNEDVNSTALLMCAMAYDYVERGWY